MEKYDQNQDIKFIENNFSNRCYHLGYEAACSFESNLKMDIPEDISFERHESKDIPENRLRNEISISNFWEIGISKI